MAKICSAGGEEVFITRTLVLTRVMRRFIRRTMKRIRISSALVAMVVLSFARAALAQGVEQKVDGAIDKGLSFLKAQQKPDGGWQRENDPPAITDRKSTRLNSSHRCISYAVFCLKKKKKKKT